MDVLKTPKKGRNDEMKLNLVADYDVFGKKFCTTFAIHQSKNLVRLREMCSMDFPVRGGSESRQPL